MKAVKIDWIDSTASNISWTLLFELEGDIHPIEITTYGVMVRETDEFVIIAQNYGVDPEQVCNIMTIPKGCIKGITVIGTVDERKEEKE